jgi:DNA-binding NarL/FixJ family response regulator
MLIVDDQRLFATSLAGILGALGRDLIEEILICYNGVEAIKEVDSSCPDIILMDIFMPGISGLDTMKRILEKHPAVKVLMLTTFGYDNYIKEAIANGASGYILKDATPKDVLDAILSVFKGSTAFSSAVLDSLAGKTRSFNRQKSTIPMWFELLTEKERKILLLIAKGLSNDEIAGKLFLGKKTIRNYISSIYDKMNAKDRFEAMRMAIEAQIHTIVIE